ncbi:CHAT domain-containing tetratricopeptide repeat protein [Nodosilinea sp. AN01ver1]|uniref:CHAT domain-containing tetratricopeptide repeat protein n=1 Tax=Nodosilinea sp. AN01ver1 TaxID=3423362 RepID=UPI003D31DB53
MTQAKHQGAEAAQKFLLKTLQLIVDKQGNPQQIYPVWAHQQAQFNTDLLAVLPIVAAQLLQDDVEQCTIISAVLVDFGNLINQFPLGTRWLNLELGIATYKQALQVRSRDALPIEWAGTMMHLANAYAARIRGDRAQNIEEAINIYQQVLQVNTRDAMPVAWAGSMNNLALAYRSRIRGDRAQNIEEAIVAYQQALQIRSRNTMPVEWAQTMNNLATTYATRIRGDRAKNIEEAIVAYKQSLQVRSRDAMPVEWAQSMNNLALAYRSRIQGDRAQNIEEAIDALQQALQVATRDFRPVEWVDLMNNLALAYIDRIRGDRAQNVERAIDALQQALRVRNRDAMSVEWADLMNNLALAYIDRIRGDRAQNIEEAIDALQQALRVRNRDAMPVEWAQSMNNLANAYRSRIRGDRAQNIEEAINTYQQALQVRRRDALPLEWATSMSNLAFAYIDRIRGDQAQNIEEAIDALQQALRVRNRDAMPVEWAQSINNLALAYQSRIRGDRAQNIENAITAYQQALQVMTPDAMPVEWGQLMNNLSLAYYLRIQGDRAQNIEEAIATSQQALRVRNRYNLPIKWAASMHNLALAYADRIQGNRAQNIENAIVAYKSSLEIYTPEFFPHNCRRTARNLGDLYFTKKHWAEAITAYQTALQAAETLYQSSNLLDGKAAELNESADLPRWAAYALAKIGQLSEAIKTLERGRARGLSETFERDRTNLDQLKVQNENLYIKYKETTQRLRNLEAQQREHMTSDDRNSITSATLRKEVTCLRAELITTLDQIRQQPGYETLLTLPTFEDIQKAVTLAHPLVYLLTTPAGSLALVTTLDEIHAVRLDNFTDTYLTDFLQTWFADNKNSLTDRQTWLNTIEDKTQQLWKSLMGPLIQQLQEKGIDRITLIPTGYLSLLPLHAAWTEDPSKPNGRRYALDDLHITYAPNAKSLTAARAISDQVPVRSILAIDNPSQDLSHSEREIQAAISTFSQPTVLRHEKATLEQVRSQLPNATIAHFSCHGTANLNEPLTSGLLMSDGLLTLKDILALNLADTTQGNHGLRLAILSACETGMIGIENADEAISLPTGLLQAGVAAVIASLWSVSDLSTMLLLTRFYHLWRQDDLEPAAALRAAQQWLRDTTNGEKAAYFKTALTAQSSVNTPGSTADYLYKQMLLSPPDQRDFAHPFHWAAFSYTGV